MQFQVFINNIENLGTKKEIYIFNLGKFRISFWFRGYLLSPTVKWDFLRVLPAKAGSMTAMAGSLTLSLSGPMKMKFTIGRSSGRGGAVLRHKLSRLTRSVSFEIEVSIIGNYIRFSFVHRVHWLFVLSVAVLDWNHKEIAVWKPKFKSVGIDFASSNYDEISKGHGNGSSSKFRSYFIYSSKKKNSRIVGNGWAKVQRSRTSEEKAAVHEPDLTFIWFSYQVSVTLSRSETAIKQTSLCYMAGLVCFHYNGFIFLHEFWLNQLLIGVWCSVDQPFKLRSKQISEELWLVSGIEYRSLSSWGERVIEVVE